MNLLSKLFGKGQAPAPPPPTLEAEFRKYDEERKKQLERTLGAGQRAVERASSLQPGQLWVEVVDSYFDAGQALLAFAMAGGLQTGVLSLKGIPARQPNGQLVWDWQDSHDAFRNLETLTEPAVLFVARDSVPFLRQNVALTKRIKGGI